MKQRTRARKAVPPHKRPIKSPEELGFLVEIAAYMRVSRTWLHQVKKGAARRAIEAAARGESNPSPFFGRKTTASDVRAWMRRNPDFIPSHEHRRKQRKAA